MLGSSIFKLQYVSCFVLKLRNDPSLYCTYLFSILLITVTINVALLVSCNYAKWFYLPMNVQDSSFVVDFIDLHCLSLFVICYYNYRSTVKNCDSNYYTIVLFRTPPLFIPFITYVCVYINYSFELTNFFYDFMRKQNMYTS